MAENEYTMMKWSTSLYHFITTGMNAHDFSWCQCKTILYATNLYKWHIGMFHYLHIVYHGHIMVMMGTQVLEQKAQGACTPKSSTCNAYASV